MALICTVQQAVTIAGHHACRGAFTKPLVTRGRPKPLRPFAQANDISNLKHLRVLELRADESLHETFVAELGRVPPRLRRASLIASQPPQLARPLPLVVTSLPPSAPGLRLRLEAPFILLHAGRRASPSRQTSGPLEDAVAGCEGCTAEEATASDPGYALCLVTRKLMITGLPSPPPRPQQQQQQHVPVSPEAVASDLAAWMAAARFSSVQIDTSAQFPTPQPIPLFDRRGIIYTCSAAARAYNKHEHGEDGGMALVEAIEPLCGSDVQLSCRLLAPERVLLECGDPSVINDRGVSNFGADF